MKATNSKILAELWDEKKAYGVNAKSLLKNIKAATKKPTKKEPNRVVPGEATLVMPEEFIGTSLPDAYGGSDMWLLFKIKANDWDEKCKEIDGRDQ